MAAEATGTGRPDTRGVGVIGFGGMGQVHARAFSRLLTHYPDAPLLPRLVAVADTEESRRAHALRAYGFEHADADWRALVARPDVGVVSVCGPNHVHREMGVAVAEAGKHLWVEKPAGRGSADTVAIATAVEAAGVRSAVGFNYRNAPAVELARAMVAAGDLGAVETVAVELLADYAADPDGALSWRFDPEYAGSGVLGDLASHGLDLIAYVAGAETGPVTELVADRATFIDQRPQPMGTVSHFATAAGGEMGPVGNEDQVSALLRFTSGAHGVIESSRVAVGEQCRYGFTVRGRRGAVQWDFRRMEELRVCAGEGYQNAAWRTVHVSPGHGELAAFQPGAGVAMGYDDLKVIEAERLVESIASGRSVGATIADAVVTAELIDAMVRSHAERRWVQL